MKDFIEVATKLKEQNGDCARTTIDCDDCVFKRQGEDHNCPSDEVCYQWAIGYLALKKKNEKNSKKVLKKPCKNCNGMGLSQIGTNTHYLRICKICGGIGSEE